MDQRANRRVVSGAEFREDCLNRVAITRLRLGGCFDQLVGYAAHGGDDHDQVAVECCAANDLDHFLDRGHIAHRRPAKLHDSKRLVHSIYRWLIHRRTYLPPQSRPTLWLVAGAVMGWGERDAEG